MLVILHAFNGLFLAVVDRKTKTTKIENHMDTTYQLFKNWIKTMNLNKTQGPFL